MLFVRLSVFSVLLYLVSGIVIAEELRVGVSLDDAKTFAEIAAYVAKTDAVIRENYAAVQTHELAEILRQSGELHIAAGEKILKISNDKSEQDKGLQLKIVGLRFLIQADDNAGISHESRKSEFWIELDSLIDELEKDGRLPVEVSVERFAKFVSYDAGEVLNEPTAEKFADFVQKAKKLSVRKPAGYKPFNPLEVVISTAGSRELAVIDSKLLVKTVRELIDFVKSDEFNLPEEKKAILKWLQGYSLRLVGEKPVIEGKTVDNKNFNWSVLRGKYVLVTFTATWCAPCRAEIPNLRSVYEQYRDKGFEIVSVYVMDKNEAVKKLVEQEKLNWTVLSDELTENAGGDSLAKKLTITNLPTTFIVDGDGKIIVTEINGRTLKKKLAELFQTVKE
ncbi:MAG: TlpA family protein disulfide reductase [Planctomycetaceae bacterium]|jgi:peroxiredoxin|nr:TlpA family protein disulfide reductase [Planctomycetaceae bacterium]